MWNADQHSEAQTALSFASVGQTCGPCQLVHLSQLQFAIIVVSIFCAVVVASGVVSTVSVVSEPMQFHGGDISVTETVRVGCSVACSLEGNTQLQQLVEEPGVRGNPVWLVHHIPARAQKRILKGGNL